MTSPFFIPSCLILLLSIPLVLGIVPRNRFYGFRTCRTLSDKAVWYPANRFAGLTFMAAGGFYLALSAFIPYDKNSPDDFLIWFLHLGGFVLPLVVAIALTIWYVKRL